MMITSSSYILDLLSAHAYAVLLPLAIVEGPLVTIAGGALVATGQLKFWPVLAVVVTGDLVGDSAFYALGRWGGIRMVMKWANHDTVTRASALEVQFLSKADQALVAGKLTHVVGALVLIVAGIAKMPFARFLTVNFLCTLPKSLMLLGVGYTFGFGSTAFGQNAAYGSLALLIAGVIVLYILMFR